MNRLKELHTWNFKNEAFVRLALKSLVMVVFISHKFKYHRPRRYSPEATQLKIMISELLLLLEAFSPYFPALDHRPCNVILEFKFLCLFALF